MNEQVQNKREWQTPELVDLSTWDATAGGIKNRTDVAEIHCNSQGSQPSTYTRAYAPTTSGGVRTETCSF